MALDFLRMVLRFYKERTLIDFPVFMRGNASDRLQTENSPQTVKILGAVYDYELNIALSYVSQTALA